MRRPPASVAPISAARCQYEGLQPKGMQFCVTTGSPGPLIKPIVTVCRNAFQSAVLRKFDPALAGGLKLVSSAEGTADRSGLLFPKRMLMVTESLARGGAERQMLALTQGLLDRGYAVEILELIGVVPGQANFIDEFRALGIEPQRASAVMRSEQDELDGLAISHELQPYTDILPERLDTICAGLAAAITRFQPSAVYGWSDLANLLGGFAASFKEVPRTILGQRSFPPPFWLGAAIADKYRQAHRALLNKPNMTMVNISSASARAYEGWLDINGKIKVIRNGFAPETVAIPQDKVLGEFRRGLGIPEDAFVVGTITRFAPEKDPDLWLRTAAAIAEARADVHFILNGYGHGDIAEQLCETGERLGLSGRLHMPAILKDVGRVYAAIDIFLLTSRTDATPNAMLEAQALGLPVVAPAIGGIEETMLDGITGALVRERSSAALADAVLGLLNDPKRQRLAKARGPGFVARKFGLERMIEETIASCVSPSMQNMQESKGLCEPTQAEKASGDEVLSGDHDGMAADSRAGSVAVMRSRAERRAYIAIEHEWLAALIGVDALDRLALDIVFSKSRRLRSTRRATSDRCD